MSLVYKVNYGTINVVALDTWAGMTGVCMGVVVQLCSLGVITPLTVVGVPCWLIPCSVLPVWLFTICGRK